MSWTIIVASSDGDQLEELAEGAEQIKARLTSSDHVSIRTAASVEEVRNWRSVAGSRRHLLIVAATLPYRQSSADRDGEPGLELVRSVGQEPEPPVCILVSERIEHYRAVQGLNYCELLAVDCSTNYVEECLALARKLAVVQVVSSPPIGGCAVAAAAIPVVSAAREKASAQRPDSAGVEFALLEVDLHEGRRATARLDIGKAGRIKRGESRPLDLEPQDLDALLTKSQEIRERISKALASDEEWEKYYAEWSDDYQAIGEGFAKLLWHTRFERLYYKGHWISRGNVRLRFNLEGKLLDGLWEAMLDAEYKRPLMIQNTITRRARPADDDDNPNDDEKEIDVHDGVLRILVIKSDVPDDCSPVGPGDLFWQKFWTKQGGTLPELPDLDKEVDVLRKLQERLAENRGGTSPQVHIDVFERPAGASADWSLANEMKRALKQSGCRYDIVHFAGHALFASNAEGKDRRGYLIFSSYDGATAVPIATVASWLENAKVQLVYLSCCRSSSVSAELEFARNNVPMTIGFNWDLEDSKAVDFAENFYDALLENGLKVCVAMRLARRELFNTYSVGDPIWASPVLVAQPIDWMQVEGVLRPAWHEGSAAPPPMPLPPTPPPTPPRRGATAGLTAVPAPAALHG
jgi:hypothetical protein